MFGISNLTCGGFNAKAVYNGVFIITGKKGAGEKKLRLTPSGKLDRGQINIQC